MIDTLVTGLSYVVYAALGMLLVSMVGIFIGAAFSDKLSHICLVLAFVFSYIGLFCAYFGVCMSYIAEIEAAENCYEGIIVSKETNYTVSTSDITYTITFEGEYEYQDKLKTTRRDVAVNENTYLAYDVGDTFNANAVDASVLTNDVSSISLDKDIVITRNIKLTIGLYFVDCIAAFLGLVAAFALTVLVLTDVFPDKSDEKIDRALSSIMIVIIAIDLFCLASLIAAVFIGGETVVV